MRYNHTLSTFASGELSPDLRSRTDIKEYRAGAKDLTNFTISDNGSAYRRHSTEYLKDLGVEIPRRIHRVKTDEVDVILIFELGSLVSPTLDVYMSGIRVLDLGTGLITNIATVGSFNFLPTVMPITKGAADVALDNLQILQIGVETHVVDTTGNTPPFVLRLFDFITGPAFIFECPLLNFKTAAGEDSDKSISVIKAHPISGNSGQGLNESGDVYFDSAVGAGHGILLANNSVNQLKITNGTFTIHDIGHMFYVAVASDREAVFLATSYISDTVLQGYLLTTNNDTVGIGNATTEWRRSAFGNKLGYPQTSGYYQGRRHYGATSAEPLNIWASDLFDLDIFMNTRLLQDQGGTDVSLIGRNEDLATYAFSKQVIATGLTKITALGVNAKFMFVGTTTGDHQVHFAATETINSYARDSFSIIKQSDKASSFMVPVYADSKMLYLSSSRDKIRSVNVLSDAAEYHNINMSVLSNRMGRFVEGIYLDNDNVVLFRTTENKLVSFTLDSNSGVAAWARFSFGNGMTIKSISDERSLTDTDTGATAYFLLSDGVNDYISKYTSNRFGDLLYSGIKLDLVDRFVVPDPAILPLQLTPVNNQHREGTIVVAVSDNLVDSEGKPQIITGLTVGPSGVITTPTQLTQGENYHVGYVYKSKLESLTVSEGSETGDARGDAQRIDRLTISLYDSIGGVF